MEKIKSIYTFLFLLILTCKIMAQVQVHRNVMLMGSRFDITIVDKDSTQALAKIDKTIAEITRIENLISEWRNNTQISEVNKNAGIKPVKVDQEVLELTKRAIFFSKMSDGAFDISTAAMDKIWKFDGSMQQMPTEEQIKKSIEKVGYKNIILDEENSTIFLKLTGMKIGFGSTGKGYAAEKGKALLQSLGVKSGIVNASGDMAIWGMQKNGKKWTVGISSPEKSGEILKILKITNAAIVTSGDYQKYVEFNGKRYSHIINPKTGYPSTGLSSVTIKGKNAEKANGISTSVMALGIEKGLELLKKIPDYDYFLVTNEGEIIKSIKF